MNEDKKKKGVPKQPIDRTSLFLTSTGIVLLPLLISLISAGLTTETKFMQWLSYLDSLDSNRDGEISPEEIKNSDPVELQDSTRIGVSALRSTQYIEMASQRIQDVTQFLGMQELGFQIVNYLYNNIPNLNENEEYKYAISQIGSCIYLADCSHNGEDLSSGSIEGINSLTEFIQNHSNMIKTHASLLFLTELAIGGALYLKSRKSREASREQSRSVRSAVSDIDQDIMKMNIAKQNIQKQIEVLQEVRIDDPEDLMAEISRLQLELEEFSNVEIPYSEENSDDENFGEIK